MKIHLILRVLFVILLMSAIRITLADDAKGTPLNSDERVVFFTTDAQLSVDGASWVVPIHAWVHELENAAVRRTAVAAFLKKQYGLVNTPETKPLFDRRVRLIAADNERGKRIVISIAGNNWVLNKTQANGHSMTLLSIDAAIVKQHAINGQLRFKALVSNKDTRSFEGVANLVTRRGVSVISDFDDTVKITEVTNRANMLEQSLYNEFQAVAGMASLYTTWSGLGASFHVVSSSPWQFYEPIDAFLTSHEFPSASMSLKYFRFKDATLLNLLKPGIETKPEQINSILDAFPHRTFVLVGDSGEQDPEVYTRLYRENPNRIKKIYIRNITNASRADERFSALFNGIDPEKWVLFDEPSGLVLPK